MTDVMPALATLDRLSDDEHVALRTMLDQLAAVATQNQMKAAYYDGKQRVRDLGISIPPHLRSLEVVAGWPGTVVDVLEERLDHTGWVSPGTSGEDPLGIDQIVEDNDLHAEFGMGHIDALIYGIAFGVVGRGDTEDPFPLITVEPPTSMTGIFNRRRRALDYALSVESDQSGQPTVATLYAPGQNIILRRDPGQWTVEDRQFHSLDYGIPVEPLVNRVRSGDTSGRSEITPAIRTYTDNGVRTLLGMEVAREFFSAPQRYVLGADESAFVDADGNQKTAWEAYIGMVWAMTADEHGNMPQVGSFSASSPQPFLAQLEGLAQLVAAESGMASSYLGIVQDNPSSADAIRAGDVRLQKRAERRQRTFGRAESRLMRKALWVRDGQDPGVTPHPTWRDAATPTRSAAADEAVKLSGAGVIPPTSDVMWERIGLSELDRDRLRDELRRERTAQMAGELAGMVEGEDEEPLRDRADALGILIRAGVDPDNAASQVGLSGLRFTGERPVALRPQERD